MRSGAMRQDTSRHYGMDWLRIGAFALLILYHTGMVLVPWPFQVKTAHPLQWVTIPMLATNAWRLMLLFVVSGYASRALLARSPGLIDFVAGRSRRLLVPLIFGMAVIVPPQSWVELTTQHGYTRDFIWFWTRDYFRFGALDGVILPTWNHLWFVVYLWLYTIVLTALVASKVRIQPLFDRIFAGDRALWVRSSGCWCFRYWPSIAGMKRMTFSGMASRTSPICRRSCSASACAVLRSRRRVLPGTGASRRSWRWRPSSRLP